MSRLDRARELFKKYNLTSDEFFKSPQGWVIVTLPGIEKIQAKENIDVVFDVIRMEPEYAVIKAIATKGDKRIESFGSATLGGFGKGTTKSHYIAEICEKRALARSILKIENLYSEGIYSEEEADDFKDDRVEINTSQLNNMKNAIIRGEMTADEAFKKAEDAGLLVGETIKYQYRKLKATKQ